MPRPSSRSTSPSHWLLRGASCLLLAAILPAQVFTARNDALGGARVASARYLSAGSANPALLTRFRDGDSFGLIIPRLGVIAEDEQDLLDGIDEFQDEVDRIQTRLNNLTATPGDLNQLAARLNALDGRSARLGVGGGLAIAVPDRRFAFSLFVSSEVDATVTPNINAADITTIQTATNAAALDTLLSEGRVIGVGLTEVGFAMATSFDLPGVQLAVGLTPKYQRVDTYNYSININNFDDNDFEDSQYRNDDSGFNLDLGAALVFDSGLTLGLVARNMIEEDYQTVITNATQYTIAIEPVYTAGVAFQTGGMLLTADVDLNKTERFTNADFQEVRGGIELDLGGMLQLRGGVVHDLEDTREDLYSAGIGIGIGFWRLDITGISTLDNTYGVSFQNSFSF